jgi:hypothetical protein
MQCLYKGRKAQRLLNGSREAAGRMHSVMPGARVFHSATAGVAAITEAAVGVIDAVGAAEVGATDAVGLVEAGVVVEVGVVAVAGTEAASADRFD